jgi:hypothetical protein
MERHTVNRRFFVARTATGKMFPASRSNESKQLLQEAAEARALASQIQDPASVRDLLQYAAALELEAARLQVPQKTPKSKAQQPNVWDERCTGEPSRNALEPMRNPLPLRHVMSLG